MKKKNSSANILKNHKTLSLKRKQTTINIILSNFNKTNEENFLFFRKNCSKNLREKYQDQGVDQYNKRVINQILLNNKTRLVCIFKELLIYNETADVLSKYYLLKYSKEKLDKLCLINNSYNKIYPSYFLLNEKIQRILYFNIFQKQRLIDIIEKGEDRVKRGNRFLFNDEKFFNSDFEQSLEKEMKKDEEEQKMLNRVMQRKTFKRDSKDNSYNSLEMFISRIDKFEKEGKDFMERENMGIGNLFTRRNGEVVVEMSGEIDKIDESKERGSEDKTSVSKLLFKSRGRNLNLQSSEKSNLLDNLLITGTHDLKDVKLNHSNLENDTGFSGINKKVSKLKLHHSNNTSKNFKNPDVNIFNFNPDLSKFVETEELIKRMLQKEKEMKQRFEIVAKLQMSITNEKRNNNKITPYTYSKKRNYNYNRNLNKNYNNYNNLYNNSLIYSFNDLPDINYKEQFERQKFIKKMENVTRDVKNQRKKFKLNDLLKENDIYANNWRSRSKKNVSINFNAYFEKAHKEEKKQVFSKKNSQISKLTFYNHSHVTGNYSGIVSGLMSGEASRTRSKQSSVKISSPFSYTKVKSSKNIFIKQT